MAKKETMTLFHYTDDKGKEAIKNSGVIQPSKVGAHGKGVYFTSMSPDEGKKAVSQNNWDDSSLWLDRERQGRADHAVKMEVPKDKVTCPGGHRDICIHKEPVKLEKHEWIKVNKK